MTIVGYTDIWSRSPHATCGLYGVETLEPIRFLAGCRKTKRQLNQALSVLTVSTQLLHCALDRCGAVYCNRSCLWVCDNGRAVSEPYYSQRAQCLRLSERLFHFQCVTAVCIVPLYALTLVCVCMCSVSWLFWFSCHYLPSIWLERLI